MKSRDKKAIKENEKQFVSMMVIGSENKDTKHFTPEQALQLLKMSKPSWELADENYSYNGTELIKQ